MNLAKLGGVDLDRRDRQTGDAVVSDNRQKLLELGVQIAKRPAEVEPRPARVAEDAGVAFQLDTANSSFAGVAREPAEIGRSADDATDRGRNLHVLVVGVEQGNAGKDSLVEERAFPTEFVASYFFRVERHIFVDVGRIAIAIAIGIGRLGRLAARIEAAAFEALRIAGIDMMIVVRLEADRRARGEGGVGALALEVRGRRAKRDSQPAEFGRTTA